MAPQGSLSLSRPLTEARHFEMSVKNVTFWDAAKASVSVVLQHLPVPDGAIEAGRLLAREGVVGEVADESLLVEDGSVAAEEAPLGGAGHDALVVLDGQADVEDLGRVIGQNLILQKLRWSPHSRWQHRHSNHSPGLRMKMTQGRKGWKTNSAGFGLIPSWAFAHR